MKFITGDLISLFEQGNFDYIAHQTNMVLPSDSCGGIAGKIFRKYPNTASVNDMIVEWDSSAGELIFTDGIYSYNTEDNIINVYGQIYPGSSSGLGGEDSYINRNTALMNTFIKLNSILEGKKLGLPLIASGLAKNSRFLDMGDLEYFTEFVQPIIEGTLTDVDITIVVYEKTEDSKEI